MYTHVIADLTKEFHCIRCGIIQPWLAQYQAEIPSMIAQNCPMKLIKPLCSECFHEIIRPFSPHPPSEPSQQT